MAQTVEEIAEILDNMRLEGERNNKNLEKVLTDINSKLEIMSDDDELSDIFRLYVSELKKIIEDGYAKEIAKFEEFQNQFNKIFTSQDKLVKSEELNNLYNSYKEDFNNMVAETQNRQQVLNDMSKKIAEISEKSFDKNEILSLVESVSSGVNCANENIGKVSESISEILKNIDFSEKTEQISTAIKALDFSSDIENILNKIIEIKNAFDDTSKTNYSNIVAEINGVSQKFDTVVENFKNSTNDSVDYSEIAASFERTTNEIANLISSINDNSDSNYEAVKDYILELSNNLSELQENFKEVTTQNISKYIGGLDNIDSKIQNLQENLTANSKNNYESLKSKLEELYELSTAKTTENTDYKNIENLNENIAGSINDIRLSFENNSKMNYENLLNEINSLKTEINSNLISKDNTNEIEQINSSLSDILANIQFLRDVTEKRHTELIENTALEIHGTLSEIGNDITAANELNFADVKILFEKISENLQETKKEITEANGSRALVLSNGFNNLKSTIENLSSIFSTLKQSTERLVSENSENLKLLNDNVDSIKTYFEETNEGLKEYVNEIEKFSAQDRNNNKAEIIQKLTDIEAALIQSSQDYDLKSENLQVKLKEFLQSIEGSNTDTEGRIAASLEEITSIKEDLTNLEEIIKASKTSNDEKFNENISLLDAGIENIVFNINTLNENFKKGFEESIQENLSSISEKFSSFMEIIENIKGGNESSDLVELIENKFAIINEELKLINTDIIQAYQTNTEDIVRAFEPIKTSIDELLGVDFNGLIREFKSQMENSFENFSSQIANEFSSGSNNSTKFEEIYKETLNKISDIEDCLTEKIQNDIELINASIASGIHEIKHNALGQIEEQISDLKASIDLVNNNKNITESLEGLKKYFAEINSKIDIIVSDNSIDSLLLEIDSVKNNISEQNEFIKDISNKNTLALETSIKNENTAIKQCFDEINSKIDILATDTFNENILDEVDEIKDIILEQKKMFESSSDEKLSAIDKYLKDVLVKIDNVDFEKEAEEIKESILNALVSLVDQISFVEETEEIKDFVEEKTDEINQNILEVQNQLKQLATNDDDAFDYKYTLQDVESDIARLRLAINNMQGNDFSDFSNDINKIVDIVENIESTLTQEQIVDLKSDIEKLNEDIVSISTRTNKLLLNSDESYKALNDGLNNFSEVILKLEDRINYLDNTKVTERIEQKIDNLQNYASKSANADKVFHQAMMYLGEWVDATTENISSISDKTSQVAQISKQIENVQEAIPNKDDIVAEIKEIIPNNKELISRLVSKFELQEARIDALESKLDRLVSIIEEKDDTVLNRKVDKLEKLMSKLDNNIEKLTSYVDEE